jgi:hypothetical protein
MNTILYTHDLEPITVVDLPVWIQESIESKGCAYILVKGRPPQQDPPVVRVECKRIKDEQQVTHKFFVTADEELCLTINPQWLPGQVQTYNGLTNLIQKQRETIKQLNKPKN